MTFTQDDLIQIIDDEIQDRSDSDHVPQDEIDGLNELRSLVKDAKPLDFSQYQWLSDLVSTYTEINM